MIAPRPHRSGDGGTIGEAFAPRGGPPILDTKTGRVTPPFLSAAAHDMLGGKTQTQAAALSSGRSCLVRSRRLAAA